jgi:hypothetical protein
MNLKLNEQNNSIKYQQKFGYTTKFAMLSVLFIVIMFGNKKITCNLLTALINLNGHLIKEKINKYDSRRTLQRSSWTFND